MAREESTRPRVSVVIPVYNGASMIEGAVRSVLDQDHPHLAVFIADNASTDRTGERVAAIFDDRVRYSYFDEHVPVASSYARALKLAEGDYVLMLAADDLLRPGALSALVLALESHPECGFVYGRATFTTDASASRRFGQPVRAPVLGVVEDLERRLLDDGFNTPLGGVLFRTELPELVIDPKAGHACDLDLMLRLGRVGTVGLGIAADVVVVRQHPQALSEDRETAWSATLEVLAHHRSRSAQAQRYRWRMARVLLWLTIYFLERGEGKVASGYRRRYREAVGGLWDALLALVIAVPALAYAPIAARSLLERGRRGLQGG
jgi:glycosyltransferase involved in cell wall biosynthesis